MDHIGLTELAWLRKIIVERALTRGDYVLAGGARSDYYIDKFSLFADPQVLRRIARMFTPVLAEVNPDLVAGTELGHRIDRVGLGRSRASHLARGDAPAAWVETARGDAAGTGRRRDGVHPAAFRSASCRR